jgi:TIR domain-containing protein
MGAIFVSYRRGDSEGQARALVQALTQHVGKKSVFMDVDGIEPGRDFRQVLNERLASCDMMLVIIGKGWLSATNPAGKRRLDDPRDFVRQEVAAALKRNIPVTPVLVQGASMPSADELPEELQDLTYRHSFELGHNRWDSDVNEMIRRLGLNKSRVPYWLGAGALALLLLAAVAVPGLRRLNTQGSGAPSSHETSPEASTLKPADAKPQATTATTVTPEPTSTTTTIPEAMTTVPARRVMGQLESNTARKFRNLKGPTTTDSASACSALCERVDDCEAMTFVMEKSGNGRCELGATAGVQIANPLFVSAVKQGYK